MAGISCLICGCNLVNNEYKICAKHTAEEAKTAGVFEIWWESVRKKFEKEKI